MTVSGEWLASTASAPERSEPVVGRSGVSERLDIASLLHPYEATRFRLAQVASLVVIGVALILVILTGGALLGLLFGLLVAAASIWAALQLLRARLVGRAVRVTAESMPAIHSVVEDVRRKLDYHGHVDVYVIDKADQSASLTSFLGTRIILLEGDFAAALEKPERQGQLVFLLASFFGALKARHQRLAPVFLLINMFDSLKVLKPFLDPYLRATRYSGDQIGYACCGDFGAAMGTLNRLLVGQELAPDVAPKGVLDQATMVQDRVLPRLAQLISAEPHLTNRYLNMLFFADQVQPDAVQKFRSSLDPKTNARLEVALAHSPHRRARRGAMTVG
jgi:hypothetical protein